MSKGLEAFLEKIKAAPTNETYINRFLALLIDEPSQVRLQLLYRLSFLVIAQSPLTALKVSHMALKEARAVKKKKDEIEVLKVIEICFKQLGKPEKAKLVADEKDALEARYLHQDPSEIEIGNLPSPIILSSIDDPKDTAKLPKAPPPPGREKVRIHVPEDMEEHTKIVEDATGKLGPNLLRAPQIKERQEFGDVPVYTKVAEVESIPLKVNKSPEFEVETPTERIPLRDLLNIEKDKEVPKKIENLSSDFVEGRGQIPLKKLDKLIGDSQLLNKRSQGQVREEPKADVKIEPKAQVKAEVKVEKSAEPKISQEKSGQSLSQILAKTKDKVKEGIQREKTHQKNSTRINWDFEENDSENSTILETNELKGKSETLAIQPEKPKIDTKREESKSKSPLEEKKAPESLKDRLKPFISMARNIDAKTSESQKVVAKKQDVSDKQDKVQKQEPAPNQKLRSQSREPLNKSLEKNDSLTKAMQSFPETIHPANNQPKLGDFWNHWIRQIMSEPSESIEGKLESFWTKMNINLEASQKRYFNHWLNTWIKENSYEAFFSMIAFFFDRFNFTVQEYLLNRLKIKNYHAQAWNDYLVGLEYFGKYRHGLSKITVVIEPSSSLEWIQITYAHLQLIWEQLFLEGFQWELQEGGQIFWERLQKRPSPKASAVICLGS